MLNFSEEHIAAAPKRASVGLDRYLWLQRRVGTCDVSVDLEFEPKFDGFYRVRRALVWRTAYFSLMEREKRTGDRVFGCS